MVASQMENLNISITVLVLLTTVMGQYSGFGRPTSWFVLAAVTLYLTGVLTLHEVLAGVANEGVVALAVLMIIAKIFQDDGVLIKCVNGFLKSSSTSPAGALRVFAGVSVLSGFFNNTPIVSLLIHPLRRWAIDNKISPSKVLIPLSYSAIVGGTLTLIGTSTNLVVLGLLQDLNVSHQLHLLSPAIVGVPLVLIFLAYYMVANRLLPRRVGAEAELNDAKTYQIPVSVNATFEAGTVEDAGLRNLNHGYLYQVIRSNSDVIEVEPKTKIMQGDTLIFMGGPRLVNELSVIKGLEFPARLDNPAGSNNQLLEVVVPKNSELVGKTAKQIGFRIRYGGVIMSIAHHSEYIAEKLGRYVFKAGDLLLVEFSDKHSKTLNRSELIVLNRHTAEGAVKVELKSIALLLLFPIVVVVGSFLGFRLLDSALIYLGVCVISGFAKPNQFASALDLNIFAILLGALALAKAFDKTGIAQQSVELLGTLELSPLAVLAMIYVVTWGITELFTNNSAAALVLPFAISWGNSHGLSVEQVALTVMIAASMSFVTPYGYQTNLMVLSAGNYKPSDYLIFGLPLAILIAITAISILYWV
ncbi:MAG: di/tricarboxylate transporter [Lentisphaeria bacterium]|jgi:di/tricarboxylate transporter